MNVFFNIDNSLIYGDIITHRTNRKLFKTSSDEIKKFMQK